MLERTAGLSRKVFSHAVFADRRAALLQIHASDQFHSPVCLHAGLASGFALNPARPVIFGNGFVSVQSCNKAAGSWPQTLETVLRYIAHWLYGLISGSYTILAWLRLHMCAFFSCADDLNAPRVAKYMH